jgi:hypothetical protein
MSKVLTDNSYFLDKVMMRVNHLPDKQEIFVLDCYSGNGRIWNEVKKYTGKNITVLRIEKESKKKGVYLRGDNLKFLKNMNLSVFDIIDLDAYGIPFKQLKLVFEQNINAVVFVTFIQTIFGGIPAELLQYGGYSKEMINKIPTLFYKHSVTCFECFLLNNGINKYYVRQNNKKRYFCFNTK